MVGEVIGESGTRYQFEVESAWDSRRSRALRVMVSIDDMGLSAVAPVSDDFIIRPDGSIVGEPSPSDS
jgi:hypothetical protein